MEIAYGTRGGLVRVVVQHPETPGMLVCVFGFSYMYVYICVRVFFCLYVYACMYV